MKRKPAKRSGGGARTVPASAPWLWLVPIGLWVVVMNGIGLFTWGHGRLTFVLLMLMVAELWLVRRGSASAASVSPSGHPSRSSPLRGILVVGLACLLIQTGIGAVRGFAVPRMIDIAENTYAASAAFAKGDNPYTSKAQLWHRIKPGPHVDVSGQEVSMYGVPYHFGYPYFPAMFLSYMPAYYLVEGYGSVRSFNGVLLALNVIGVAALARRLSGRREGFEASLLALIAYLCVYVYSHEIFSYGVVDILISTYALYAFIALAYEKYWVAGILFGLTQACKLLPGPFLIAPVIVTLWGKRDVWKVVAGYVLVAASFILPFWLWDPGAFLSATILFYLTRHAAGDNTSLWFFLPESLRGMFSIVGGVLSVLTVIVFAPPRRNSVLDALTASFSGYAVFMAFGKMTHLNYLWGVYPLGCVSLGALIVRMRLQRQRAPMPVARKEGAAAGVTSARSR